MTTPIPVEPLYLSNCTFSVADDSYEAAVSGVMFTPSTPSASWTGLSAGSVFTRNGKATWMCALTYVQDWSTASSLANYLHANEGNSITVDFIPDVDDTGSPTISATLIIAPGAIGGKVNAFAETTANLACQGKPTVTPPA